MHLLYAKCMERGESIHNKLLKFFMMPMLMMLISVGQVWGQETTVSVTEENFEFTSGATNGYYTITNSEFTNIATIKVSNKTGSRVKIANGSDFTIEAADNKTITKIVINWRQQSQCPIEENELIVSPESAGTFETSNLVTTWTGNISSGSILTFKNNSGGEIQFTGISITYTTGPVKTVPSLTLTGTPTLLKAGGTTPLTTTSDVEGLSYTYTSSNTSVATVDANGLVSAVGDGSATITVTSTETGEYASATATWDVTVDVTAPTFSWVAPKKGENSITLIADEPITLADYSELSDIACLNDEVDDRYPSKAPVIGDDKKTVTITFNTEFAEGVEYDFTLNAKVFTDAAGNENSVFTQKFTIEKPTPNLSASDIEVTVGSSVVPNVQYDGDGTATYSGYESIATFADGKFTGTQAGTATVTVNYSETENYKAATETFTLTVKEKPSTTELYTVKFNNKETVQSPEGYFTFEGNHNYKVDIGNITYNDETYVNGLKLESSTKIIFTTEGKGIVTIIQGGNQEQTFKFDGEILPLPAKTNGYYEYNIEIEKGTHTITRGGGETTILFISVSETPSVDETAPVLSLRSNKIKAGSNLVVKANEAVTLAEGVESVSATINGTDVTGTLNTEDNTITFSTDGLSLDKGAEYSIVVAANQVQDASGNKNSETTLAFNTKSAVNITADDLTLNVGETKATTVSVPDGTVSYTGHADIATFTDGKFTGLKAGSAPVTATVSETDNYEAGSATFTLTVSKGAVTLSATEIAVQEGSTISAGVTAKDASGKAVEGLTYTYSSADESIASVDANGKITGNKIGSTTINVAFAGNDNYNSASATIKVTVTKKDAGVANHWDFTSWDSEDIETIIADEKWEDSNSSENVVIPPYTYSSKLDGASFDFQNTEGLLFSASSSRLTINAVTDGAGYIRLHNTAASIALPALTAGQIITLTTQSASSAARGLIPTDDCKTYVELVSPSATGYGAFQSLYRVTAEGAGKNISFHS